MRGAATYRRASRSEGYRSPACVVLQLPTPSLIIILRIKMWKDKQRDNNPSYNPVIMKGGFQVCSGWYLCYEEFVLKLLPKCISRKQKITVHVRFDLKALTCGTILYNVQKVCISLGSWLIIGKVNIILDLMVQGETMYFRRVRWSSKRHFVSEIGLRSYETEHFIKR